MNDDNEMSRRFQVILDQHKGILFKVARTYCHDENDKEDLIQEMLIQIWKSIERYNDKYAITTWLYRICINVAISFYRKTKNRRLIKTEIHEYEFFQEDLHSNEKEQQLILLEKFIEELNEFDKALMLLYLDEKPQSEIADILGISLSNVSTKVGRIKEKLKKRFALLK